MALILAGERSGVGKTTVTLALLSFLAAKKLPVQSFKVGPDYIDPMFHTAITDRPCRNLDPILTSEAYVKSCFDRHCQGVEYALVEGVMGLFDGVNANFIRGNRGASFGGQGDKETRRQGDGEQLYRSNVVNNLENDSQDFASTAHIARLLDLPILLVLDCSRLSGSIAAIAHGYSTLDPRIRIAGIILNRVGNDRHLELLQDALLPLQIPILGILRRQEQIAIPDRHLGLVPTAELEYLQDLFDRLAVLAETSFDWQKLLPLLQINSSHYRSPTNHHSLPISQQPIRIAVASDRAFSFYYQDNLDILTELGAQLIYWSPLEDRQLPDRIDGFYFGGGFPEVFAQQLSENINILAEVKSAIQSRIPTYAECGGLMYLCQQIVDFDGNSWQMLGILSTNAIMSKQLTLGYRRATALQDTFLLNSNDTVFGHQFHRSQLSSQAQQSLFVLEDRKFQHIGSEGWHFPYLHASYLHLHFGENEFIAKKFLKSCRNQIDKLH
jgi:cobyrinic acid a,c-diamide synthase